VLIFDIEKHLDDVDAGLDDGVGLVGRLVVLRVVGGRGGVLTTPSCALRVWAPGKAMTRVKTREKTRGRAKMGGKRLGRTVIEEISSGDLLVYFYKLDASKENGAKAAAKKVWVGQEWLRCVELLILER